MSFTYPDIYFLSAQSADGHKSLLGGSIENPRYSRIFLLHGAVGTGKSAALISAAEALNEAGAEVWLAQNPLDPDKIEGVFAPDIGVAAIIGAYPHCVCERRSGIREITVDFGAAVDTKRLLRKKDEIRALYDERAELYKRAGRYISAARSLEFDSFRIAADCTDGKRAAKFAMMTAAKALGKRRRERGNEEMRFLSALTPDGVIFRDDTVNRAAEQTVIISDGFGAASRAVMTAIRYTALELGFDIITCVCPLTPEKCEHIIVPEVGVAFVTENRWHKADCDTRRYHARRFCDMSALKFRSQRLMFNRKATEALIKGACDCLSQARERNRALCDMYAAASDSAACEQMTEWLADEVTKI